MARHLSVIECIHYIDFSGNLEKTICELPAEPEIEAGRVTLFLSSPTCPACQDKIQARIAAIGGQLGDQFSRGCDGSSATSNTLRMLSSLAPDLRIAVTP